jgi:ribonuclease HI
LLIEVYFDGLCQPINPGGIPCYAFVVKVDGNTVYSDYGIAGEPFSDDSTNNVAEYTALVKALQWLLSNNFGPSSVEVMSDSQLIVNQLTGDYKVKAKRIISLYKQVLILMSKFQDIRIKWVPREKNREADRLTNKAYNKALQENPEYLDRPK